MGKSIEDIMNNPSAIDRHIENSIKLQNEVNALMKFSGIEETVKLINTVENLMPPSYLELVVNTNLMENLSQYHGYNSCTLENVKVDIDFHAKDRAEAEFKYEVVELLRDIKDNTADLGTLVSLIQTNTEQQSEVIELLAEILLIAKATTKEDTDSLYRNTMNKIQTVIKDVNTIATLTTVANTVLFLASK